MTINLISEISTGKLANYLDQIQTRSNFFPISFPTRVCQMICYSLQYCSIYLLFFKTLETLISLNRDHIKQSQLVGSNRIQHVGTVWHIGTCLIMLEKTDTQICKWSKEVTKFFILFVFWMFGPFRKYVLNAQMDSVECVMLLYFSKCIKERKKESILKSPRLI